MKIRIVGLLISVFVSVFIAGFASIAAEINPVTSHYRPSVEQVPTGRIIVKFRSNAAILNTRQIQAASDPIQTLAHRVGISVVGSRSIAPSLNMHVMRLLVVPAADTQAAILANLRADPDVEYAEPDQLRYPHSIPNDPNYSNQWFLQPPNVPGTLISAIDAQDAWTKTTGSKGVVIAQLDTGVRFDHPDLLRAQNGGRLLPGYDFVGADFGGTPTASSTYLTANDGDGWDPDSSDPGDWISSADQTNHPGIFNSTNCPV
ncbi:MAG TPA: hypothetical protein VET48_01815, partial [Steroidobacteraceae bacterium]|nr:hypothetical protein [Steroidobacteraceae bacterium]